VNDTSGTIGFPENPKHGDIFEYKTGLYFQYDGRYNSWVALRSNQSNIQTATTLQKGAMSSEDLQKLNRLVLPVPNSTITSEDCSNIFKAGVIGIYGGDKFVGVDGNVNLQNLDEFGDLIAEQFPFKIHQHTNGFDFTLDLESLVKELIKRNQIVLKGKVGDQGARGEQGDDGLDTVLAGPPGSRGPKGAAPACDLTIEEEVILNEARSDVNKALVNVRIKVNESDPTKYSLEFDRQEVGVENYSATKFDVKSGQSPWLLAVSSIGPGPQSVYHFDMDPLVNAIKEKYETELSNLKKQYENITAFWIQKMSDLFDEQKAALCCALEYCRSITKSTDLRQHMESVAASALPDAKIVVNNRNQGEEVSSTNLFPRLPDGSDLCGSGGGGGNGGGGNNGGQSIQTQALSAESIGLWNIQVDPITQMGNSTATSVELPAGRYTAVITEMMTRKDGKFGLPIKIEYINDGRRSISFLNKGQYDSLKDARNAYEGLSLGFEHQGGDVKVYYPVMPSIDVAGKAEVAIKLTAKAANQPVIEQPIVQQAVQAEPQDNSIEFEVTADKVKWLSESWNAGLCCGMVVNIGGQDYIIVKRSVGDNKSCGGGATEDAFVKQTVDQLGDVPAIAWPTLDGNKFAPVVGKKLRFVYDPQMCEEVADLIDRKYYLKAKGNPSGPRHLSYQLSLVLFPKL
jgi:hypothetical protein